MAVAGHDSAHPITYNTYFGRRNRRNGGENALFLAASPASAYEIRLGNRYKIPVSGNISTIGSNVVL